MTEQKPDKPSSGEQLEPETTTAEQAEARLHRFKPGQSGNPAGRPKGARHVALLALDAIGQAGAEAALKAVAEAAAKGDMRAAEILLRRVWPERKGRPVTLDLPPVKAARDLPAALAAIAQAVAAGELTPDEGQAIAGVLETQRRAIELTDIEERLAALEGKSNA